MSRRVLWYRIVHIGRLILFEVISRTKLDSDNNVASILLILINFNFTPEIVNILF